MPKGEDWSKRLTLLVSCKGHLLSHRHSWLVVESCVVELTLWGRYRWVNKVMHCLLFVLLIPNYTAEICASVADTFIFAAPLRGIPKAPFRSPTAPSMFSPPSNRTPIAPARTPLRKERGVKVMDSFLKCFSAVCFSCTLFSLRSSIKFVCLWTFCLLVSC